MNNLIDPAYASEFIASAASGFGLVVLFSVVAALFTIKSLTGRRITFMVVLWSLFLVFCLSFYGLNYLMRKFWGLEAVLGGTGVDLVSVCVAVGLMSLVALYWKFAIHEGPTLAEVEQANLKDEEMTPLDFRRKEHMEKYSRKKR